MPAHHARPGARWTAAALGDLAALATGMGVVNTAQERLARHTSMGVGGPCPLMVWPRRPEQAIELAGWIGSRGLTWRVLGGGSNLLVDDGGIDEPVFHTGSLVEGAERRGDHYRLPAGMPTARALRETVAAGLDGLVWSAGLPGSVGGAAAGNAGCWGGDMAGSTSQLDVVDAQGRVHEIDAGQIAWSYRHVELAVGAPWIVLWVTVRVQEADRTALEERYLSLQERKRERQPIGARNSGCIFRNPDGDAAGRLIDQAGCKGLHVGGAEISSRHANFIVNRGGATSADIISLVDLVVRRVHEATGFELEPEIRRW